MSKIKTIEAWHFSEANRLCRYDNREIIAGETLTVEPPLEMCQRGLHASRRILDAVAYAPGSYVWRVALSGQIEKGNDKLVAQHRTALWGYDATDVLRQFSRLVALQAVEKYWDEKYGVFPDVVLRWLKTGDESLRAAAGAAAGAAARSAAAEAAAGAAARSAGAWSAAEAAGAAARSAAAEAAPRSAAEAAGAAARAAAARSAARAAAWSAGAWSAAMSAAWSAAEAAGADQNSLLEKMILEAR